MSATFCIFREHPSNIGEYIFMGNGFFIDNDGTFITAGHVFSTGGARYICFYEEGEDLELIPVMKKKFSHRIIYDDENYRLRDERHRSKFQCAPEYKDVAVGKVDLSNTEYLNLVKKRPYEWDSLSVSFCSRNQTLPLKVTRLINGKIPNSFITTGCVSFTFKDTRLTLAEIPYGIMPEDKLNYYNNAILLNGKTHGGISGSPVLNQRGSVIGIVSGGPRGIAITSIILSRYVIKKSRKLLRSI